MTTLERWRQEDQGFKIIYDCRVSSKVGLVYRKTLPQRQMSETKQAEALCQLTLVSVLISGVIHSRACLMVGPTLSDHSCFFPTMERVIGFP